MRLFRILALMVLTAMSLPIMADSETGLILGAEVEKKFNKKFSLDFGADMRTRNDFKTMDRWSIGLGASYKFTKWLKADAGYRLLDYNYRNKKEYYTSSKGNAKVKWRPSYWGIKHRIYASVTLDYKFRNGLKLALRERWQYNYRPAKSTDRYKGKISEHTLYSDTGYVRKGKGLNQLRSRFQIEYDKKRALFTPYANIELYHSWGIEKIRYTIGTDIRLSKQHSLEAFYRYQDIKHVYEDEYDPDMHYIGVGYKFKF